MNRKKTVIVAVLIILIIVIFVLVAWNLWLSESLKKARTQTKLTERQEELAKSADERMAGKTADDKNIIIASPQKGELIISPLAITGQINGGSWSGFEGQAGTVKLLDENAKVLGTAVLETTTDWMKLPTKFKAVLNFSSSKEQNGKLIFKNENPSGMPENNRELELAVKIGKTN